MGNNLKREKQATIIGLLCEGVTVRGIERITGVHRDTILRLQTRVGEHCERLMEQEVGEIYTSSVQCDELYAFVGKKARRIQAGDNPEWGDAYTFVGIDRETKFIIAMETGKRDEATTDQFIDTLSRRVCGDVQIFTDGFGPYRTMIPFHFGRRAHFMQVVKSFDGNCLDEHRRYSPPKVTRVDHHWVQGSPKAGIVSTSHIERQNWSIRGSMRRFTRLSNGFSRKLANLRAAVAVYVVWYNWVKKHTSLGTTPAVAMGLASASWTIDNLLPGVSK